MNEVDLRNYEGLCRWAVEGMAREAVRDRPKGGRSSWMSRRNADYGRVVGLAMAQFDPASPYRGDEAVWRRLDEAMGLLDSRQHEDGLIDLPISNFHSPPDTAFMVDELVPLYEVIRDGCPPSPRRDRFLRWLERLVVRACNGIAAGGVHTPNHRWKVASALMLADRLWPHLRWRKMAEAYLAEGIDIDEDGEFSERSAGCYNYVCDRALITLARATGREELAEYADRNLRHMLYLLHADGTLVTSFSRRQDRDTTVGIERYFLLYWYRALMRGDGQFWSAAELALRRSIQGGAPRWGGTAMWLRYLREAGGKAPPAAEPLPQDYEKRFDGVGVVRRRSGPISLTLMAGSGDVLAVRFGAGPEIGLRISASFANEGTFRAEEIRESDDRYVLRSHHTCKYYGPWRGRGPATDVRRIGSRGRRKVFVGAELTMTLEIELAQEQLCLRLRSEGCPHVPVEVAFLVRSTDTVEAAGRLAFDEETRKHFLDSGELLIRQSDRVVRIGPGSAEHDLTEARAAEAYCGKDAYCVRLATPLDATLTMRAGESSGP